jgi:hypothetical protein
MKQITLYGKDADIHYKNGKPTRKSTRKQLIEQTINDLGGHATIREIAEKLNLNVNGISQTIGCMCNMQPTNKGKAGDTEYILIR